MTNAQGGRRHSIQSDSSPKTLFFVGLLASILLAPLSVRALQFDVFLGYGNDGVVREANWFPVTCEINNDGPAFTGVVELGSANTGSDNVRRFVVELPTDTRKRIVIPVFAAGGRFQTWNARLLDERGKSVAAQEDIRAGIGMAWDAPLMGALSRTFPGSPRLPEIAGIDNANRPRAARFRAPIVPDNPIALEGMNAFYLNSESALDLSAPQAMALQAWLHAGGNLIVAIESPGDINGAPWLNALMPCDVSGGGSLTTSGVIQQWLRNGAPDDRSKPDWRKPSGNAEDVYAQLKPDPDFEAKEFPIANVTPRDGSVELKIDGRPLIVTAARGRGLITALAFSPEREPFRGWKNRRWFWAHMMRLSPDMFRTDAQTGFAGHAIDGVFGGMVDSKQVRKLPVHWLLLLLVVYLLVIGPFDQWWLKKINHQMLTWITFPCYVVLFSVLIYWIGFMLRAGETEWNELHVVDVHPRGDGAELRGRTYASIYSPSNKRYGLAGVQPISTLRGEYSGAHMGASDTSRATVTHKGDGYDAEVYVPVWTSQLYVNDWWQSGDLPIKASLKREGSRLTGSVSNLLGRDLSNAHIVYGSKVHPLDSLNAGEVRQVSLNVRAGQNLHNFVQSHAGRFVNVINQRRQAFGSSSRVRISNIPASVMAASFIEQLRRRNPNSQNNYNNTFVAPGGFEISEAVDRGQAVILAWDAGGSLTGRINQFSPRRSSANTMLRLSVPTVSEN